MNWPHCMRSAFHLAVSSALELSISRDASRAVGRERFSEALGDGNEYGEKLWFISFLNRATL